MIEENMHKINALIADFPRPRSGNFGRTVENAEIEIRFGLFAWQILSRGRLPYENFVNMAVKSENRMQGLGDLKAVTLILHSENF